MTTREDRLPNPAVDRDRAIAALIYCASKHPDKTLGLVLHGALGRSVRSVRAMSDEQLAAAFHSYAKEPA